MLEEKSSSGLHGEDSERKEGYSFFLHTADTALLASTEQGV